MTRSIIKKATILLVLVICICIYLALLASLSTLKTSILLFVPVFALIIISFFKDIMQSKATQRDWCNLLSAFIASSFAFWPSLFVAMFTNYITIIIYCIVFLFILKLYTILLRKDPIF